MPSAAGATKQIRGETKPALVVVRYFLPLSFVQTINGHRLVLYTLVLVLSFYKSNIEAEKAKEIVKGDKKERRVGTKMVKVILFHLFNGQQVVGIDEEPLAITHASTTILAATKAGNASPSRFTHYSLLINHLILYFPSVLPGRVEGFAAGAEYVRAFSFETANDCITGLHHVPALDWYRTAHATRPHPSTPALLQERSSWPRACLWRACWVDDARVAW